MVFVRVVMPPPPSGPLLSPRTPNLQSPSRVYPCLGCGRGLLVQPSQRSNPPSSLAVVRPADSPNRSVLSPRPRRVSIGKPRVAPEQALVRALVAGNRRWRGRTHGAPIIMRSISCHGLFRGSSSYSERGGGVGGLNVDWRVMEGKGEGGMQWRG